MHSSRVDVSDLRRVQFSPPIMPVLCAHVGSPSSRSSQRDFCLSILRLRSSSSSLSPGVGGSLRWGLVLFVPLVDLSPSFVRFADLPLPEHDLILCCRELYRLIERARGGVTSRTSTTELVEKSASNSGSIWFSGIGWRDKSCVVSCF